MEDIFKQSDESAVALQQAISNYKKTPTDRKTLVYCQKKQEEINQLWEQFNKLDNLIRNANPALPESHVYFMSKIYETIGQKYNDFVSRIESDIRSVKAVTEKLSDQQKAGTSNSTKMATSPLYQKQQKCLKVVKEMLREVLENKHEKSINFYTVKLKTIEHHWALIQQIHEKLWMSEQNYDFDQFLQEEKCVNEAILSIHDSMTTLSSNNTTNLSNEVITSNNNMKLPKLELPTFNGDYVKWRQFRDLFLKMVHQQPLSLCQKLCYLQSSVQGEAARLIQHFTATDSNYEDAWEVLNKRYENKRLLVDALLQRLLSQKATQSESASSIKALHDTTQECMLGLKNLDFPVDTWDAILVHILAKLLDRTTRRSWERSLTDPREVPSMKEFMTFLEFQFESEEMMGTERKNTRITSSSLIITSHCIACNQTHGVYECSKFLAMNPKDRLKLAQTLKACVNCLKTGHNPKQCQSKRNCKTCGKRHNTLLHLGNQEPKGKFEGVAKKNQSGSIAGPAPASLAAVPQQKQKAVLLSTIKVQLTDEYGREVSCRAVLDNGSQVNFITQSLARDLGLKGNEYPMQIQGIGQTRSHASERVNISIASYTTGFSARIEAQVLPKIVSNQPSRYIDTTNWKIPNNLQLADPEFNTPGEIDLLIGAGLFYSVLSIGQIKLGERLPILQNTLFGWILGGEYSNTESPDQFTCAMCTDDELNTAMERFWEIDECSAHDKNFTAAEIKCENYFTENTRRGNDGRLIVKLPFQYDPKDLGKSYDIAVQRFMGIERRLSKCPELKEQYTRFMHEYQQLGHMEEVALSTIKGLHYFLPHHAVVKPDSTTTKLRVVFDASAKTSTNVSLNELLATGPVIQDDVFSILLRFRQPRYVFTADIEKMYRQIWVHENDRDFQLILWRSDPQHPIRCFKLKTITYGTACAPYLAIRCLRKLAEDHQDKYPLATSAIKQNFYVDDVLAGSDDIRTAVNTQIQLRELLTSAGLYLRKWCANDQRLLKQIPAKDQEVSLDINQPEGDDVKTMGLTWRPAEDYFTIKTRVQESTKVSKRSALADISRMFDPLGFMAPVTIKAKMFMQQLWRLKLDWDAALPQELHTEWVSFRAEIKKLEDIKIPRHVFGHKTSRMREIHIFADASEKGYGVVSYVRSVSEEKLVIVRLLCAKSKVAPTKQVTLPRLELCAAKLAAELMKRLQKDLDYKPHDFHLWSDSTAVLGWIQAESSNFHTFVANRISYIQRITNICQWHHVSSENNPADMISRGLSPHQLIDNHYWFYGPKFLHSSNNSWAKTPLQVERCALEEKQTRKAAIVSNLVIHSDDVIPNINHGNSFRRLQRIIAYMLRISKPNNPAARVLGKAMLVVRAEEMDDALTRIIRHMQRTYADEMQHLRKYKAVQHNSPLSHLTPFIDEKGILRVGGRLEAASISYDAKHPILLSHLHPLTNLLLSALHKENLHAGVQTLLAISRQKFWIVNGKTLARGIVHKCVQCTKAKPKLMQQMMGNLPKDRIVPSRPFVITGVDFFGPVYIHFKIRGKRPQKAYVSVFCCFSTKAVHMELVSDLTTEAFLGALKRFMGRRGHCQKIYCDNATNFVGAKNFLVDIQDTIHSEAAKQKIISICSSSSIEFCFIPPRAPHFGGLWEAAVKSAKTLMQNILMSASLTYEEMETVVIEAEAILNSRPITPMSADPNDMTALTPGHFLIGEPITSTINQQAGPNKSSLLTRWKLVAHLKSEFWKRWSSEYLQQLQHRYKWKQKSTDIQPGMMVIIKEDNLPPLRWPLGRIETVITGDDGLVRVVDVKTATTKLRRPIHRLALLPTEKATTEEPKEENDQATTKEQHHSTRKRKSSSNIATLLLTCLILPLAYSLSIKTTKFEVDPGIYFERVGMANIISSDWSLINYFDLQPYRQEYEIMHKYMSKLTEMCVLIHDDTSCQKTIMLIQRQINIINANNQFFKTDAQSTRNKRGAFNFVGNMANGLFGVLDSAYAEQLSSTIDEIKQNVGTLRSSIQNQTSFLDQTMSLMKRNQMDIDREFKQIEKVFQTTIEEVGKMSQQLESQQALSTFNAFALQAFIHMINFQGLQEAISDILTDAHHGKISPQLLTVNELKRELETIKLSSERALKLPLSTNEMEKYYRVMTVSHKITAKYIIFIIKIPLITSTEFEVLKLTAVPWYANDTFQQINLSTPYLIVDLLREHFQSLSKDELQKCLCIDQTQFLCLQTQPLYNRDAGISSCEINVLKQSGSIAQCNIGNVGHGPFWLALQDTNSWIYAVSASTQLDIVCDSIPSQFVINGIGKLQIGDKCTIKTPYLTLHGHQLIQTTHYVTYIPTINVSKSQIPIRHNVVIANYTPEYHPQSDIEGLQTLLAELKTMSLNTIRPHDIHHYGLGYLLLIGVVALGVYAVWHIRRQGKEEPTPALRPEPAPRSTIADAGSHIVTMYDS